jgi:glucose/arabinose dehydrogenase
MRSWLLLILTCLLIVTLAGCASPSVTESPAEPTAREPVVPTPESLTDEPAGPPETEEPETEDGPMPVTFEGFTLGDVGFSTPESALMDTAADMIYVSNINGSPGAEDDNGFISRLSPEGELIDLRWIDGAAEGVTLSAPKGMAIVGEELFVADISAVRVFDRVSGAPLADIPIEGARFLNDVAAGPDGLVYVSDSATGSIYKIGPDRSVEEIAQVEQVNGLAFLDASLLATSVTDIVDVFGGGTPVAAVPAGGLDGLVVQPDGIYVSSWETSAVYRISPAGEVSEVVSGVGSPADIGFDPLRRYVLIPLFDGDAVQVVPVP